MATTTNNNLDVAFAGSVFHAAAGKADTSALDIAYAGSVFHVGLVVIAAGAAVEPPQIYRASHRTLTRS